jgi:hypothetical protein
VGADVTPTADHATGWMLHKKFSKPNNVVAALMRYDVRGYVRRRSVCGRPVVRMLHRRKMVF